VTSDNHMEMDLTDIDGKYPPFWYAVRVTARDKHGQPTKGVVVCQHITRRNLSHELAKLAEKDLCVFQALEKPRVAKVMV